VKLAEDLNHRRVGFAALIAINSKGFPGFEFIFDAGCPID
jgi:hypothetical protein